MTIPTSSVPSSATCGPDDPESNANIRVYRAAGEPSHWNNNGIALPTVDGVATAGRPFVRPLGFRFAVRVSHARGGGSLRPAALTAPLLPLVALLFPTSPALAQQGPLQPGEAVVTRFSGTTSPPGSAGDITVLNPGGTP